MKYRPDIDGLRALAILPVILFHLKLPFFAGGFVGVDIFFVISGFLITSILLKEFQEKSFSLSAFYERRLRRIFPASAFVIIASYIVAAVIMLPEDFENFSHSALATIFYVSNIFFWQEAGYFSAAAEEKPLLHTWSLAVEEQFYIIFPLLLMFLFYALRQSPRRAGIVVAALTLMSFFGCIVLTHYKPSASFYLLPTRAWELGVGAILAFVSPYLHRILPKIVKIKAHAVFAIIGLACLLIPIFTYNAKTTFPGALALWPCLGAALIIASGMHPFKRTFVTRLLSSSPLVFIGRISYALYLWHWPVLAFAQYRYPYIIEEPAGQAFAFILTFTLAVTSWHFIEKPFRNKACLSRRQIFGGSFAVSLLILTVGVAVNWSEGLPQRYAPQITNIAAATKDINPLRKRCHTSGAFENPPSADCHIGDKSASSTQAFLWGDSHADSMSPAIDSLLKDYGLKGVQVTKSSCAPIILNATPLTYADEQCQEFNREVLRFLQNTPDIRYIFISSRWAGVEIEARQASAGDKAAFLKSLGHTVNTLEKAGKQVFLISATPEMDFKVPQCLARQSAFNDKNYQCPDLEIEAFKQRQEHTLLAFSTLAKTHKVFFPDKVLCTEKNCHTMLDNAVIYYDDDHLSIAGALKLVPAMKDAFSLKQ